MRRIVLQKGDRLFLEDSFYQIIKGKLVLKDILKNGKVIITDYCAREGEIIGDYLQFSENKKILKPDIAVEVEALEKTIIEEFEFSENELKKSRAFEKIMNQLLKNSMLKFMMHLYDKKGYLLLILKLYANSTGEILKKEVNYNNFNISKSQFYLIYSKLKDEGYLCERREKIYLNLNKIEEYLMLFDSDLD